MQNNGYKAGCGFDQVIVSYIYDEIDPAQRVKFDEHLNACISCADEFASVSSARFAFREWQQAEFAHLNIPKIVLENTRNKNASANGWIAGLKDLFAGFGIPVTAVALLILCIGVGLAVFNFFGGNDEKLIANVNNENINVAKTVVQTETLSPQAPDVMQAPVAKVTDDLESKERPPQAVTARRQKTRPAKPEMSSQYSARKSGGTVRPGKAPVLSNFEDNSDKSLRLSDLFAEEIGSGK